MSDQLHASRRPARWAWRSTSRSTSRWASGWSSGWASRWAPRWSLGRASRWAPLLLAGVCACGGAPSLPSASGSTTTTSHSGDAEPSKTPKESSSAEGADPLFPESEVGWTEINAADKSLVDAFARDYLAFLNASATQRECTAALLAMAKAAGAKPFDDKSNHKSGELLYWLDASHSSLALLKIGSAPVQEGVRVLVSSSDAAHLRLTPVPIYEKAALALFDTTVLGDLDLESWLHVPLALHVFIANAGAGGAASSEGRVVVIGDGPDEPVFSIPDLLPHLSRKVQRDKLVDSAERLDAVAGFSRAALIKGLAGYGISAAELDRSEAVLVPAGGPSLIGVDRALIAASNQHARAQPFAALRSIVASDDTRTQLVIIMGSSRSFYAGAGADDHLANLLPLALQQREGKLDALAMRRVLAKSSVLLFDAEQGERNEGVALNTRRDDSGARIFRHALQLFAKAGVQVQILESGGWSQARELASLDVDTVELGLPISGEGKPYELMSVLDLYQGLKASRAWLEGETP